MVQLRHLATLVTALLATAPVLAAETSTRVEGSSVRLEGMAAQVTVKTEDRADVAVDWRGSKRFVDAVQVSRDGATAVVRLRPSGGTMSSGGTVVANNVTTVVGGGGSATVTIGGQTQSSSNGDDSRAELTVRMPKGGDLALLDGNGPCDIGEVRGRFTLRLSAGTCRIASLGQASEITLSSGEVSIGNAAGTLWLAIAGSGKIEVRTAHLDVLHARIEGAGDIGVGGEAGNADLSLAGVGSISVARVVERPRVQMTGAGAISVGNWP